MKTNFLRLCLAVLLVPLTPSSSSSSDMQPQMHTQEPLNGLKIENIDLAMRNQMLNWSRQLGVTCNYCHDLKNFKSDKLKTFKIAQEHNKMLRMLNDLYFSEVDSSGKAKNEQSCYVCHRGQGKAKWQEPPNNLTH